MRMFFKSAILVFSIPFFSNGCSNESGCGKFISRSKDPLVVGGLTAWVDEGLRRNYFSREKKIKGNVIFPGNYSIGVNFDPAIIGMSSKAEARVVVDKSGEIDSVFLGEENMSGIFVMVSQKENYLIPKNAITWSSSRVGVVCHARD
jgi:hypothetical protein